MKYKTIYVLSVLSLSIMMAACGKNSPEVVSDTVANVEETEASGEGTEMNENKEMPVLEYLQEIKMMNMQMILYLTLLWYLR